ncbi:MAG: hypothetical protein HY799_11335 [Nitrosomonadales bacterium]|nr:hypothetical protein [Nitrosomonadales bacterium]
MSRYLTTLIMLTLLPAAHAGELGRLFNTPQQRQQMEFQATNSRGDIDSPEAVKRNYIIVNGVVQKQGGNRTVWINGAPQAAERGNDKTPASVPVSVPGKIDPVHLKVGQRLILDTPAPDSDESKPAADDD